MSSTENYGPEQDAEVFGPLPPAENRRFYPALNGLRAIAVLMVFMEHYFVARHVALNWGWAGVNIFFVLSGFLITGILYDSRDHVHRFRNFYARRALRIFPLYYAVLLFALVLYPIYRWKLYPSVFLFPLYLQNFARFLSVSTWVQSRGAVDHLMSTRPSFGSFSLLFGHLWSLAVEEQFYLIWPFVVFSIKKVTTLRNVCIGVFLSLFLLKVAAVIFVPVVILNAELVYRGTPFCMDALALGGLLAALQRGSHFQTVMRLAWPAFWVFVTSLTLFLVSSFLIHKHPYGPFIPGRVMSTGGITFIDLFCAIIVLLALQPDTVLYRLLCFKPLRLLGEMSYGFYVFHDLFHLDLLNFFQYRMHLSTRYDFKATALTAFFLTLALSYLSFRFFEAPILRLKSRF